MNGQAYVDLAGAFLVLMLIAASGFAAIERLERGGVDAAAMCAGKNAVHAYADWLVKAGGTISRENADGSGYYLHHEMDLGKIKNASRRFGVTVSYADGRVAAQNYAFEGRRGDAAGGSGDAYEEGLFGAGSGGSVGYASGSQGNVYCVERVALCDEEICKLRVCNNEGV